MPIMTPNRGSGFEEAARPFDRIAAPDLASGLEARRVLSRAVLRAGDHLGLSSAALARVLGLSGPTLTRMRRGDYLLDGKGFELGVLFVRLYRSLDAIVGGDDHVAAQWMQAPNLALGEKPANLVQKVTGLFHVIHYLDARRAIG
jgi:hypothetical protein